MPSHPDRIRRAYKQEKTVEYSLTNPRSGKRLEFPKFLDLLEYLQHQGEVDGWILHIHHM